MEVLICQWGYTCMIDLRRVDQDGQEGLHAHRAPPACFYIKISLTVKKTVDRCHFAAVPSLSIYTCCVV